MIAGHSCSTAGANNAIDGQVTDQFGREPDGTFITETDYIEAMRDVNALLAKYLLLPSCDGRLERKELRDQLQAALKKITG